jgi:Tol biopolymer transport system component
VEKVALAAVVAVTLVASVSLLRAQSGPQLGFDPQVFIAEGDGSGARQVSRGGGWKSHPTWSPEGGRLAYVQHGISVFTLATGKTRRRPGRGGSVAWSPRRDEFVLVLGSGNEDHPRTHVARMAGDGTRLMRLTSWTGSTVGKGDPAWSPDGRRIAYARERARRDPPSGEGPYCICGPTNVGIVSRTGTAAQFELKGDELHPAWSPNGKWILFARQPARETFGLWRITSHGRRLQRVGPRIVHAVAPLSWSPDGKRVAFTGHYETGARDQALFVLDATPAGVPRLIGEHVGGSAWSPTANLIAFTDFEGHVRVTAPDGSGQRTLATFPPDTEFRYLSWSRDGRRLAFTAEKQRPSD